MTAHTTARGMTWLKLNHEVVIIPSGVIGIFFVISIFAGAAKRKQCNIGVIARGQKQQVAGRRKQFNVNGVVIKP